MQTLKNFKWYSNIKWGPCYDPKREAHFASATDFETLNKHYGPIDPRSCLVDTDDGWQWLVD